MSISNPIDIQLPQVPMPVEDTAVRRELETIYNAIHLLHAALAGGTGGTPGVGDVSSAISSSIAGNVVLFADTSGKLLSTSTVTNAQLLDLTDSGASTLHYHSSDRDRANHTGTQLAATVSDFDSAVTSSTHAGRTDNPHVVTAAQAGAYTSGEVDTLLLGYASIKWPMVADVIDVGEEVIVPANKQLIVGGAITNNGTLTNSGKVVLI